MHRVVLWGRLAEIAGEYLAKGKSVYVEGRLQTREYEKDGVKRYTTEIVADRMQMLSPKGEGTGNSGNGNSGNRPSGANSSGNGNSNSGNNNSGNGNSGGNSGSQNHYDAPPFQDDDIPFD